MHRLPLLLVTVVSVIVAVAPASAQALPPAAVVQRFVAGVDARDATARPCAFLSRRVRSLIDSPLYLGRDPRFPDSYRAGDEVRACDVAVALTGGFDEDRWSGTELVRTAFVARHGDRLQLRATVVRRFRSRPRARRTVTDVFLLKEDGAWRIVSPARLWELGLDDGAPRTFAQLGRHLRTLARWNASNRADERRLVRGYLTTRVPIATAPLPGAGSGGDATAPPPAGGPVSAATDPLRDVIGAGGSRVADQAAATVDLRGAALRSGDRTIAFELRFRDAVPRDATLAFSLRQGGGVPGTGHARTLAQTTWSASLHDGWASAWRGEVDEPNPLRGLRASAAGDTLRLSLPARALRGRVRLAQPFRWTLAVSAQVTGSDRLGDVWIDSLPERQDLDASLGTLHRP